MLEIQLFLQHAHTPDHREYRSMWKRLFETSYDPLKNGLRRKFSNILFEDIEDIVIKAFTVFQMKLIRQAALRDNDPIKRRFITFIEERGFVCYLFNLCNWLAFDFLRTQRRQNLNILEIDQILVIANKREFYEDYEGIDAQSEWLKKVKAVLNERLYLVFEHVIKGRSHKSIAEEHGFSEDVSKDRKRRAIQKLEEDGLLDRASPHTILQSISILFIIAFF